MTELQSKLHNCSHSQLVDIIQYQYQQSVHGRKDVVKAMELMRKKSEKLQAEFTEASQRAVKVKSVDVCFALDCTGSMGSQIQAAKEKIFEIQNRMETCLGQGGNVRFAVVGYRDYGDQEQFQSLPLTEDVKEVEMFLSNLKPYGGGGDSCEDVIGGLSKALQLDWQARTRIIYLVCDAPPHGNRFKGDKHLRNAKGQDLQGDLRPDDQQQWETTDMMMTNSVMLNLNLVLLDFAPEKTVLERTFQVFSNLRACESSKLRTLCLRPHNTADDLVQCIMASTKETISKTLARPSNEPAESAGSLLSLDVREDVAWNDWKSWPLQHVALIAVNVIALTSDTYQDKVIKSLHIRPEPFASGNMRYAFPATSMDGVRRYVVKVHKDARRRVPSVTFAEAKTQSYARLIAEEFSRRCGQVALAHCGKALVQFLDAWAMELPQWEVAKDATLEPFVPGVFRKYTNNNGYISPEGAEVAEALCHFSYTYSGGQMMLADVQGFDSAIFTDPQIHCVNKDFSSPGNLGQDGVDQFFLGHVCNDFCRVLDLKEWPMQFKFLELEPEPQFKLELETASTASGSTELPPKPCHQRLQCQYCHEFVSLSHEQYIDLMDECQEIMCLSCREKAQGSRAETRCKSCEQPFMYFMYTSGVKGSIVPPVCRSCEHGEIWKYIEN